MGLKTIIPYSMGEMWIEYSQVHRTPWLAKQVGGVDSFLPFLLHEMKKKKKKDEYNQIHKYTGVNNLTGLTIYSAK